MENDPVEYFLIRTILGLDTFFLRTRRDDSDGTDWKTIGVSFSQNDVARVDDVRALFLKQIDTKKPVVFLSGSLDIQPRGYGDFKYYLIRISIHPDNFVSLTQKVFPYVPD